MKPLLSIAFIMFTVFLDAAIPPPYQPNAFSTNVAGNPVLGQNNISITNVGSTTNWEFFNVGPRTVARLIDVTQAVTSVAGNVTNALSIISSNGTVIALGVTNLDFIDGTNAAWKITNVPSGDVHVAVHVNPGIWINGSNLTFQIATACSNLSYQIGLASSNLSYSIGTDSTNYTDSRSVNASNLSYTIGANGTNYIDTSITALSNNVNGAFIKNLNGLGTNTTIRSPLGGTSIALTVDTNALVVTNGSVGIGTNNPIRIFHVRNDPATPVRSERASSSSIAGHIEMYNSDTTDGNAVSLDFLGDSTGVGASPGIAFGTVRNLLTTHDHATRAGDMAFLTLSPSGNLEKMRIKSLGQVGIGTNNPQARLHVVGDGTMTNLIQAGTTLSDLQFAVNTNGQVFASNGFRLDTNVTFADNEWVTEEHLQAALLTLEGATYFVQTNDHPVVSGTKATRLTKQTTDQYFTNVLSAGSNQLVIWLSTNFVSSGIIPAGNYDFHIHARKTSAGPDAIIGFDLVRTNGSGISTLANGETNAIPSTTESDFLLSLHLDAPVLVSTTDYIGIRYYAIRGGGAVSVITHVGGVTDSHFTTPNLANGGGGTSTSFGVSSNGTTFTTATNLNFVNAPLMTNVNGTISIDMTPQPTPLSSLLVNQVLFDDFLYIAGSGTISSLPPFGWQSGNSGGTGGSAGGETNAPGIWRMSSGGTAGNVNHLNTISTSSGGFGAIALGHMTVTNQWRVRMNPIPTIADGGRYTWGFGDTTPNITFNDGVWFEVNTNRFNWVCLCASNGVVVGVTNTTTFPTNNVWYNLMIAIDELGAAATFYVDGVPIATNAGTLPLNGSFFSRTIGLVAGSNKQAGATSMTNDLDYCYLSYRLNAVR